MGVGESGTPGSTVRTGIAVVDWWGPGPEDKIQNDTWLPALKFKMQLSAIHAVVFPVVDVPGVGCSAHFGPENNNQA